MKKVLTLLLSLSLIFSFSVTASAASPMTFDEAKSYLQNYSVTKENSLGKGYTTQYVFDSEEDLNKAAAYIAENGLDAFNESLEAAIATAVANEPQRTLIMPVLQIQQLCSKPFPLMEIIISLVKHMG